MEYLKANVTHEGVALAIVDARGQLFFSTPSTAKFAGTIEPCGSTTTPK
jgi:hypothetical protein